ncbi:hypothetical protein D3C78_1343190 [compost metagenome]
MTGNPAVARVAEAHLDQIAGDRTGHLLPGSAAIFGALDQATRTDADQGISGARYTDHRCLHSGIEYLSRLAQRVNANSRLGSNSRCQQQGGNHGDAKQALKAAERAYTLTAVLRMNHVEAGAYHCFYPQPRGVVCLGHVSPLRTFLFEPAQVEACAGRYRSISAGLPARQSPRDSSHAR